MSFRARQGSSRARTWDDRDRRSMLLNVGFGLTVIAALLLLLLAFGVSWYNDHLTPSATVNGQTISRDAFRTQLAIDAFRLDYQQRRIRTLLTAGRIRTTDAQTRLSILDQRRQQASSIALEELIDGSVMGQLAAQQNVTVSDADVDQRLADEATTPELRHAWMIAIAPTLATGETEPTDAEKAAAKAKADQALADLNAGKDWDTVAKSVSTDASKDQAGDLGWIDKNAALNSPFLAALTAAQKDAPTAVVEGDDGTYRIGRVTDIVAPVVDATLQSQVQSAGIKYDDFKAALRREVVRTKLSDAVLAPYLAAGLQRHVQEIKLAADIDPSTGTTTGKEEQAGAVKIRHILYSPGGDPQGAPNLPATDPKWKEAQDKANATYQKLLADPSQFSAIAMAESNDPGSASRGGTYWFTKDDSLLPEFSAAIFKEGLQPGQLLPPTKTAAGWHVIQYLHPAPDSAWATKVEQQANSGVDFGKLAEQNSDGTQASKGGDIGWVGKGQLVQDLENAIFATKVGGISAPVTVKDDGVYLFKVLEEQTRDPDADQKATIENSAFSRWYTQQKAGFTITRDPSITASGS